MKKEIYINISITEFRHGYAHCEMLQSINDGPLEVTKLDRNHANKLIWELVLAGGKRGININRFNRNIVTISASILLPN